MLTRGWRGTSLPRAIKNTTRTELRNESIYIAKYIHWNTDITPTALHNKRIYNVKYIHLNIDIISMALRRYNIRNAKYIHRYIGITPTASVINKQFIGLY